MMYSHELLKAIEPTTMKKYKLKEEVKKYFDNRDDWSTIEMPIDWWYSRNVSLEALEEVPQRIKLIITNGYLNNDTCHSLRKELGSDFTKEEIDLCEKAINGELFDEKTMYDFTTWLMKESKMIKSNKVLLSFKEYLESIK